MHQNTPPTPRVVWLHRLIGMGVIALPVCLLWGAYLVGVSSHLGNPYHLLLIGSIFQIVATLAILMDGGNLEDPARWPVLSLYVIALGWFWLGGGTLPAQQKFLTQGILLGVPLLLFARLCLRDSGALAIRRARLLVDRLMRRQGWPADLQQIRQLREVRSLREALGGHVSTAFPMLVHSRLEIRLAALAALAYRSRWESAQANYLLDMLRNATEPEIRAAVLLALACVEERGILEAMCECLWDSSPLVRQAAADSLLWNTETRWPWIRIPVRQGLAHAAGQYDGSLIQHGTALRPEVVVDLISWTAEKGTLAERSALTLGVHYNGLLHQGAEVALIRDLERQLTDSQTPALWRMELARLMGQYREVTPEVAQILLDPANPAPLRLLAVETLLGKNFHQEAIAALIEVARLPNREMALAAAEIVQRRLNVDLGLQRGQTLPAVHSRQAAEVVRNVLIWADRQEGKADRVPAGRYDDDDY